MSTKAGKPSWLNISTIIPGAKKMEKRTDNPMQPIRLAQVPRCLARTRSGKECQSPVVRGKRRCRMHGGTNPGPPRGNRNAWKHGGRSAEAQAASRYVKMIAKVLEDEFS
jgi:glucans biosynthesis protein